MSSKASLRIFGKTLDPDHITKLLGCEPTRARIRGDRGLRVVDGREWVIPPQGSWLLDATERGSEDLDGQIAEIFDCLNPDPEVWALLRREYKVDLFCGLFMVKDNEGLTLSPTAMMTLASRGIPLGLDIYEQDEET